MSAVTKKLNLMNFGLTYCIARHLHRLCIKPSLWHMATSTAGLLKNVKEAEKLLYSSSSSFTVHHEVLLKKKLREESLQQNLTSPDETEEFYKLAMRRVPQQVVVLTTALHQPDSKSWIKRGVTCSSFCNVSVCPPIISFCLSQGSRMHDLIKSTGAFAVHILAQDQVYQGIHFSKPAKENHCQFDGIPHVQGDEGMPIILGCLAVLLCDAHSHYAVGDHMVWYGNVNEVSVSETLHEPLIYFTRQFRSIGDEIFLKAFEDATLPFENWTHEAHLRMAWNYIKEYGKDGAVPYIKLFIQKYNEKHRQKLKTRYHETITMFFIHLVSDAVIKSVNSNDTFEDFLSHNQHLMNKNLIFEYYKKETLFQETTRNKFVYPDIKNLP